MFKVKGDARRIRVAAAVGSVMLPCGFCVWCVHRFYANRLAVPNFAGETLERAFSTEMCTAGPGIGISLSLSSALASAPTCCGRP